MSVQADKYVCPGCGSSIANNKRAISNHEKTKKHLSGFNAGSFTSDEKKASERQRIQQYRARRKAEIGEQKYKDELKAYKREYRQVQKDKQLETKDANELKANLDEMKNPSELVLQKAKKAKAVLNAIELKANDNKQQVIAKMLKATDNKMKESTAKTNLDRVANLYKYMYNNKQWDYVSINWLQDIDRVVDSVNKKYKDNTQKTRSNQYVSIAGFLKFFPEQKELYKRYSKLGSDIVEKLDTVTKDNKLSERQSKWMNWKEVEKVWYTLKDSNGGNTFLRALYAIICFIPPRRIMDYQLMKVIRKDKMNEKKIQTLDKRYNYLFINKDRKPLSFTIYNYKSGPRTKWGKTNNNSGQYTLNPIPDKLAAVLQEYIEDENVVNGQFLFGLDSNHNKHYSENAFSSLVSNNLFETFSGVHMNVNALRSSYASWHWDNLKSLNDKENLAFRMGSSVYELSKTYYKIELTPSYK